MTEEEFAREFEKAAKLLSKMSGKELLFEEDTTEGRSAIVYAAFNGTDEEIRQSARRIAQMDDGCRRLIRALNNIKAVSHNGTLRFVQAICDALDATPDGWDKSAKLLKITQILDAVTESLRDGLGWLDEACMALLESGISHEDRLKLWMSWCAATLRACSVATSLIESVGANRITDLSRSEAKMLRDLTNSDTDEHWDRQSAALYLLLGNGLVTLDQAQDFVERAYTQFPLESLEGVELLALAVENDAAALAEADEIQKRLVQLREDCPALREISRDALETAWENVMRRLPQLPDAPYPVAMSLSDFNKNEQVVLASFLDDTRRSDFLRAACKQGVIRSMASDFFSAFSPEHRLMREFSSALVATLLENCNTDAMLAQQWLDSCDAGDTEQLKSSLPQWQTLFPRKG